MKHIQTFENFIAESAINEAINEEFLNEGLGILPQEDYPIYFAVRTDKIGNDYMANAVLPDGTNSKYKSMNEVLEELRNHYGMSKGEFPSNKTTFNSSPSKRMDLKGTSIQLNWGKQNKGYQLLTMFSPDKKELDAITALIAKFAKK